MKTTDYKDYLEEVYKEFEDVDEASIRMIVRHGLVRIGIYRKANMDIFLYNNMEGLYYYMGELMNKDPANDYKKRKKYINKLRLLYRIQRRQYDGQVYFGLTDQEYEKYLTSKTLDKVILYRILKECEANRFRTHFFKLKLDEFPHWRRTFEEYDTQHAEKIK